ncbi:hypothetical protein [Billgrantia endophytica]|uniref:hypothetical protein n=1 Tax=Billgrantia endophytica TaxID=2033802 RepID=UPI00105580F9|nr:hypothetical protein [Halomonas endophytica]
MEDKKREVFYVEGVGRINSIEEMAEKSGNSIEYILMQRGKGATDEQIFNRNSPEFFKCHGVTYLNSSDFIKKNKIKQRRSGVFHKLRKGASLEEVLEYERSGKIPNYYIANRSGRKVVLEGVEYESIQAGYDAYIDDPRVTASYTNIKQRIIEYGWDDERAFFTETRTHTTRYQNP